MAVEYRIKWKQGDFITLGKAVAQYNRKINLLNQEERKLYLPDTIKYQEIKELITTRKELNRVLNSLRRFSKEGAEDLYITQSGEQITKWEHNELVIQSRIAQDRLNLELNELNKPLESGFSRAQMGSERVKQIERQLENLKSIELKKGYEFRLLRERIHNVGVYDYKMKQSIRFKEYYIKEMEKYSHFDNYDKLMAKLNSIKNPFRFFEEVSIDELTKDLTYQSDQYYSQEEFNKFVQGFGIDIEEMEDSITEEIEDNYTNSIL